jgi:hypothetical protein
MPATISLRQDANEIGRFAENQQAHNDDADGTDFGPPRTGSDFRF